MIDGLAGRKKSLKYDLSPGINIFWGLNGSGKTSLLKILHSAMRDDAANLLRVPFRGAEITIESGANRIIRRIELGSVRDRETEARTGQAELWSSRIDSDQWLEHSAELVTSAERLAWVTESSRPTRPAALAHRYLPISRMLETRHRPGYPRREISDLLDEASYDQLFAEQIQTLWREYNNTALLRIRRVQESGIAKILSAVIGVQASLDSSTSLDLSADVAFDLVADFFQARNMPLSLGSREEFNENYARNSLLQEIVGEIAEIQKKVEDAQEPQHRIEELVSTLFGGGKKLAFAGNRVSVRSSSQPIPLASLSSGEKQLIRILLECVAARTSCIIVDEPELSMHVDWQHRLVECMRTVNPHAQIILATHSPEVMAKLPDDCIYEL